MMTHCEACGERLGTTAGDDRMVVPQLSRIASGPQAGLATYLLDGRVVHECAPGTYVTASLRATPRPDRIG